MVGGVEEGGGGGGGVGGVGESGHPREHGSRGREASKEEGL